MKTRVIAIAPALALAAIAAAEPAPPPLSVDEVVERVNRASTALSTWSAGFVQRRHFVHLDYSETRSGTIRFKRDVGLRIDFAEPAPETIVVADDAARQWKPRIRQFHVFRLGDRRLDADDMPVPLPFASGAWRPAASNDVALLDGADDKLVVLQLTPHETGNYQRQVVWLDPATWLPVRLKLVEATDDEVHFGFSEIAVDGALATSLFELKPPRDAEVVEHDELPSF